MPITDEDRRLIADLAMRAIDTILEDYGEDADLIAASLVFEVSHPDEDGDVVFDGNYTSLDGLSPHHVAGLMRSMADYLTAT